MEDLVTKKPKIAFIDDEKRILRSLKMHFRGSHDVFVTTDPHELFDYVQQNQVDVIVSDQRMPDIKGTQVLRKVKELSPNTVRILLTGYADLNAVVDSVNQGEIYRYITKPWDNDELKVIVNKATQIANQTQHVNFEDINTTAKVSKNVLVLDDEEETYLQIKKHFEPVYKVVWANNLDRAAQILGKQKIAVAIADITLDGEDIVPIVYELKNIQPDLMMLMLTEFKDAHMLIDLINKGQIFRCLPRPTNLSMMGISLDRAYQHHIKMVAEPVLQARHQVEAVPEEQKVSFSSRIKSFLSLFSWKRRSV